MEQINNSVVSIQCYTQLIKLVLVKRVIYRAFRGLVYEKTVDN